MKRYQVQTFGCQMNVHDSRRIEEVLHRAGYGVADSSADADLIIVNTCSIREKAEHKLMSLLGRLREIKEVRPELVLAVAGCVAQQEGERLLDRAPFVDLVIGPDNIPELPGLIDAVESGGLPIARTVFDLNEPHFLTARPQTDRAEVTAYVTVMKGCDERCTYCIVPYTRGPERYRSADSIVEEIRRFVSGGVREVTLLGQTVNSWYEPGTREPSAAADAPSSQFAGLLRRIATAVPELVRLRYTSPHPRHLTDALLEAHRDLDVLAQHVHLPVQSGSDRMLRRMLRRYSRAHYIERARDLLQCRPGMTLSTDIIVGFPGETEQDFEETLSLVREVGFVAAFGFKYSPRPYTPALKLGDDVPEPIKDERLSRLFAVVAEQQSAHLRALVGTRQTVIIEGESPNARTSPSADGTSVVAPRFMGRSARNEIVHVEVPAGTYPVGQVLEVMIDRANKHSLAGRAESVPPGSCPPLRRTRLPVIHA